MQVVADVGGIPGKDCNGFCKYCYFRKVKDVKVFGCAHCLPNKIGCERWSKGVSETQGATYNWYARKDENTLLGSGNTLTLTAKDGLKPNKAIYSVLDFIVNTLRSFPFVILMVIIIPFTRLLVGKTYGTAAAIVPLTIAAAPFVARIIESSLREVDKGVIEAAKSFGASNTQIIFKVKIGRASCRERV